MTQPPANATHRQHRPAPTGRRTRVLPLVLFLTAVAMVVTGINLGEATTVFEKAVTVCLACIGIG